MPQPEGGAFKLVRIAYVRTWWIKKWDRAFVKMGHVMGA